MLHIAGGTYFEHCIEPNCYELFGSGVRAASVAAALSKRVILHTFVDPKNVPALKCIGKTFGFGVATTRRKKAITFSYLHALARPTILRDRLDSDLPPIRLSKDNILRFGMLEGDAVVHGNRVVYDPQSPDNPVQFQQNGSTARQLAIIANLQETRQMTGSKDVGTAIKSLHKKHDADVVIVKQGPLGAVVATEKRSAIIPAFKTSHIWPIGSGDVFSACFAALWADNGENPFSAALTASWTTAYYCNHRTLPLPTGFLNEAKQQFPPLVLKRKDKKPLVYLAGPFFTMAQRWLIAEIRHVLQSQGLRVFSPYHDVGRGSADDVVPADIAAIRRSDGLFAIVDGTDSGTLFEVGYARARGIPVVAFAQAEPPESLKMLAGTNCAICEDFVTAIYKTIWAVRER